jgi:OmpA-OmpF porin, OOP family
MSPVGGFDGGRLTAAGAGMMAPVASNGDEAGRAKNRRVVLVKLN